MRHPHRLQGQKVKSQGGAGAYCGGHLAAQLVSIRPNQKLFYSTCALIDMSMPGQGDVTTTTDMTSKKV